MPESLETNRCPHGKRSDDYCKECEMSNLPNLRKRKPANQMTVEQMLAGAKFYARASAVRAVHGQIPDWDDKADEANWQRTRQDIRNGCLDMVRGIAVAAFFETRQDLAFARAQQILGRRPKAKG